RRIRKQYAENMQLRVRASEIVHTIVHRGRSAPYPRGEDETFQIAIDALARHGQEHVTCTSIFWERFFVEVDGKRVTSTDRHVSRILHDLLNGRPLFGVYRTSDWAYYAYLQGEQVASLRDFVRADSLLSGAFDVETALAWLDATCDAGRDVWCWVS